jgi:hypothetical protein
MATEKWTPGAQATWATAFTTAPPALAAGQAIMSDLPIDNATNLDEFMELSIHLASAAFVINNFVGVYLYPLNYGGVVYGDGRFVAAGAGPPGSTYYVGSIPLVAATQAQDGIVTNIPLMPVKFCVVLYNGGTTPPNWSAGNTCQYRTYNRSVA